MKNKNHTQRESNLYQHPSNNAIIQLLSNLTLTLTSCPSAIIDNTRKRDWQHT